MENGFDVDLIEEDDLEINNCSFILKYFNKFINLFFDFPLLHLVRLLNRKNLTLLNSSEILVISTNSMGLTLGLLKNLNLIRKPIFFIAMGVLPSKTNIFNVFYYRYLLKSINLICLSKNEKNYLRKKLPNKKISYLPFGVDIKYWKPRNSKNKKKYILAIGNDYARDWKILFDAWEDDFPELKIVTSLPLKTRKNNITFLKEAGEKNS